MKEIDMSFRNQRVRLWFVVVLPKLFTSIVLFILLPREYHLIPIFLPITALLIYYGLLMLGRYKGKSI